MESMRLHEAVKYLISRYKTFEQHIIQKQEALEEYSLSLTRYHFNVEPKIREAYSYRIQQYCEELKKEQSPSHSVVGVIERLQWRIHRLQARKDVFMSRYASRVQKQAFEKYRKTWEQHLKEGECISLETYREASRVCRAHLGPTITHELMCGNRGLESMEGLVFSIGIVKPEKPARITG